MKVKISNTIYDSDEVLIMLELTDKDKVNIGSMGTETQYCAHPDYMFPDEVRAFIGLENE